MSDTPEPLAAILADYRADIPAMTSGELPHPTPEYLRILLDRIEAAVKRERAWLDANVNRVRELEAMLDGAANTVLGCAIQQKQSAPGNAAAMRKALERIVGWCEGCHADACEKVCRPELTSESIHAALAALAAPARNVDRFHGTNAVRDAFDAFAAETGNSDAKPGPFLDWLLAPAEGGAE